MQGAEAELYHAGFPRSERCGEWGALTSDRPIISTVGVALPRRRSLWVSLTFHGALLAWLLHSPVAIFVSPNTIQRGENGRALTEIYWTRPSSSEEQRTLEKTKLIWKEPTREKRPHPRTEAAPNQGPKDTAISASNVDSAAPGVGSPYGSLSYGPVSGIEVRPAIRIFGSEPLLQSDDLAGISEGNEIIEITIDIEGNIVEKTVVQSLGARVDAKVTAALADWRFRPATRNGAPIPSKQDVYYHFPRQH